MDKIHLITKAHLCANSRRAIQALMHDRLRLLYLTRWAHRSVALGNNLQNTLPIGRASPPLFPFSTGVGRLPVKILSYQM
jgi:hypothetical protein